MRWLQSEIPEVSTSGPGPDAEPKFSALQRLEQGVHDPQRAVLAASAHLDMELRAVERRQFTILAHLTPGEGSLDAADEGVRLGWRVRHLQQFVPMLLECEFGE